MITVKLTEAEAAEVWAAMDSHAQDLSNNERSVSRKERAALNRAIDKFIAAFGETE